MKVLVVGGGPSGLMCALKASEKNQVILIEKNYKVGMKIYITGKGRCNITNNCSPQEFINHVVTNPKFLYSSINKFNSQDTINFFESRGVKLVTERGNRVFPYSYHASDITKVLLNECLKNNVDIHYLESVIEIKKVEEKFIVKTNKDIYCVDQVVIATGGKSYPHTGSTGDGYRFAKELGINVIDQVPSLVPLKVDMEFPRQLYKFTLKNVVLSSFYIDNNKLIKKEFGELMILKKEIAGPIAISLSSIINRLDYQKIYLEIDFKPALEEDALDKRIKKDIEELRVKSNTNLFILIRGLVPSGFIEIILKRIKQDGNLKINQINAQIIRSIIYEIKHFRLKYLGLDSFDHAIVTSGGIDIKEISPKFMESKKIKGLYFVGEVLDVDAYTGGFNMQIALSTGFSCGEYLNTIEKKENN